MLKFAGIAVVALLPVTACSNGQSAPAPATSRKPVHSAQSQKTPGGQQIGAMRVGESGYAHYMALSFDKDHHGMLAANASVGALEPGMVTLRIERRADGYHVWLEKDETYIEEELTRVDAQHLPVVTVHLPDGSVAGRAPDNMLVRRISAMKVGETGYIVFGGIGWDDQNQGRLQSDYTVTKSPTPEHNTRIERRTDGYHVWEPKPNKQQTIGINMHGMEGAIKIAKFYPAN